MAHIVRVITMQSSHHLPQNGVVLGHDAVIPDHALHALDCHLSECRYGAFPDDIIKYMWRAKQPYNVSVASETAALAAISNPAYTDGVRDKLIAERGRLFDALQKIPFLKPYPSQANFILCSVRLHQSTRHMPTRCAGTNRINAWPLVPPIPF